MDGWIARSIYRQLSLVNTLSIHKISISTFALADGYTLPIEWTSEEKYQSIRADGTIIAQSSPKPSCVIAFHEQYIELRKSSIHRQLLLYAWGAHIHKTKNTQTPELSCHSPLMTVCVLPVYQCSSPNSSNYDFGKHLHHNCTNYCI